MQIEEHIEKIQSIKQYRDELQELVKQLVRDAGTEQSTVCAFDSMISLTSKRPPLDQAIAIDIGGTNTRASFVKSSGSNNVEWVSLFEVRNEDMLPPAGEERSFVSFMSLIANKVKSHPNFNYSPEQSIGCVVIWSNAAVSKRPKPGFITGLVDRKELYKKGEWFVETLSNGDDIGQIVLASFANQDIEFDGLVVGNDTPLTLFAVEGANAGMVLSTGINVTVMKQGQICNAEMGSRGLVLPSKFFLEADLLQDGRQPNLAEEITAGKFLPYILESHVVYLAQQGTKEFDELAAQIIDCRTRNERRIKMRQIAELVNDLDSFCANEEGPWQANSKTAESLQKLAMALIDRGSLMAALFAYSSVCEQFAEAAKCKVALDSRLCRGIPYYLEAFKRELAALDISPGSIALELVYPLEADGSSISIPMQGGVRALSYV